MKSKKRGKNTSAAEVLNVSPHGIWILVNGAEFFLDEKNYPWFRYAKISEIFRVKQLSKNHLFWPDLDIDIEVACLKQPQHYPLISQKNTGQRKKAA